MKVLLLLALSGYWALSLCAPVPSMMEDLDSFMDMDMNETDNGHGSHNDMPMWFHFRMHQDILFREWHTMNYGELVGSAIALAVLAALYEGYKVFREEMLARMSTRSGSQITLQPTNKVVSNNMEVSESGDRPLPLSICSSAHILQAFLHFIQVWLSYVLMLAVMTYNVIIILFICFGAAVGYWAFAWRRSRIQDNNEHCH